MDISERLAAFAAGDLAADERAALEAQLAGDPSLRAELAAIRKVDRLLADLPPATPTAEFSARLRSDLRAELATTLAGGATVTSLDEARTRRRGWQRPLTAVAAAAGIIGIVGIGLSSLRSTDDAPTVAALEEMSSGAADAGLAFDEGAREAEVAGPVYVEGGQYDKSNLDDLGTRQDVRAALAEAANDPLSLQDRNLQLLAAAAGLGSMTSQAPMAAAPADGAEQADTSIMADAVVQDIVSRCVPTILDEDRVPLFADLGRFNGTEALIIVLGSRNADGNFERLEFWALSLDDDCTPLHFSQNG